MTHAAGPTAPRANRGRGVLRGLLLVAVLGLWLVVGYLGGTAQGTLSQVQENDQAAFLPASAESTLAAEAAREFEDGQSLPVLVVMTSRAGALTAEQVAAAQAFAEEVPGLPLPDGGDLEDALAGPVVAVPAEDGEAVLVPVALDAEVANEAVGPDEERLVNVTVDALRELAAGELADAGLEAWVTGPGGYVADLVEAFAGIDGILLLVALAVVLVILVVVYRSPVLPLTVLLTAVFALCLAALVVKPLAGGGVLALNGQSQGILSILVVGATTDYSLLLVARYREELGRHERPAAAMRAAWRASLEPVLASAGTVVAGLLCLLLSDLGSNASLGPVAAIGIVSSVLAALTLLPALLLAAGRRSRAVFWPRIPRLPRHAADPGEAPRRAGLWARVARFVSAHARPVWAVTAVVLLLGAAFVPTLRAEGTGESEVFLSDVEAVAGEEVLAEHFDAGQVQPVTVVVAEDRAEEVLVAVRALDGVAGAEVVVEGAGGAGAGIGGPPGGGQPGEQADGGQPGGGPDGGQTEPVVVDGRVLVEVTTDAGAETQEAVQAVRDVRAAVHDVDPDALVGGAAAERLDTQETAARDLRTIIPVVLAVIFVLLVLLLRAVVAPLILLLANVLSFAATMGLSAVVFNHVAGFPGADPTVPLYGFVFLVALGIDYSIFLMTRVREESLVHGTHDGVRRGLAVTGGVITSAGLVLAATFSALAVIPLLFLAQLAFIVAAGVLIDTLVVRSLLVPGLVHDVGRRSWWPWQSRVPAD
ncbi:MMPL family transporter [Georgenia sp. TF02-10]|uniref:MMPL family transporter n=1 Tax=Georgenia sp. TF02-10 TaxID=2917725 RepID=UPI001FA7B64F|nr:MMPL family transporter [Georgenia sp. TF02-10]UNX54813.1 MMPL family transporter [Georgenia sp. TF02-10]